MIPFLSPLQIRELFHLEFLRRLGLKLKPKQYALKDGVNMRFFFGSPRYSEDMDCDARDIGVHELRATVMNILTSRSLKDALAAWGVKNIGTPDMAKAKQTETTQRFKIHLTVSTGEDLFTKIEFSRRGMTEGILVETVRAEVLRTLRLPPLLCPHYGAEAAMLQKIQALAGRSVTQARDIFDLYLLSTQAAVSEKPSWRNRTDTLKKALENIYAIDYGAFRDTVLSYLSPEEQAVYDDAGRWDEIRLIVSRRIEELL